MTRPERRRFKRRDFGAEVEFTVLGKTPSGYASTDSRNLSTGGVCIITFEELSAGQKIALRITLPKFSFLTKRLKKHIYARGRVIWVNTLRILGQRTRIAYEAGVEFTDMTENDRESMRQFTTGIFPR